MESPKGAGYEQRIGAARGAFASVLDAMSDDELLLTASQVAAVTALPGWERMTGLIGSAVDRNTSRVVHGAVLERHEYAALTGMVAGLEQAALVGEVVRVKAQERQDAIQARLDREA